MKYHIVESQTIITEHDIVTLEDLIQELQSEKILSSDLKMKKVRKILRKDKFLSDTKLHNHFWIWTKELRSDVKIRLAYLFKHLIP